MSDTSVREPVEVRIGEGGDPFAAAGRALPDCLPCYGFGFVALGYEEDGEEHVETHRCVRCGGTGKGR